MCKTIAHLHGRFYSCVGTLYTFLPMSLMLTIDANTLSEAYLHWESFQNFQRREAVIRSRMQLETRLQSQEQVYGQIELESRTFERETLASHSRIEGQLLRDVPLFTQLKEYYDSSPEMQLIWQYLSSDTHLHCRRTLDQYMYSTLPDTSVRDRDQILYKCSAPDLDRPKSPDFEDMAKEKPEQDNFRHRNISVVEHFWMFVLDNGCTILS
jgi:hypothetical protein